MTEEDTKDLTDSEKLNLILAELADLRDWRAKVDAFIEDRSRDTRPLWEVIHAQTEKLLEQNKQIVETLHQVESKLELLTDDVMNVRAAQRILAGRVSALEQKQHGSQNDLTERTT